MKEQKHINTDKPELLAALDTWEKLGEYWLARPYLRLGQIVSNAWQIHPDYKRNPEPDIQDVFYLSDKKLIEGLELLKANESKDSRSA